MFCLVSAMEMLPGLVETAVAPEVVVVIVAPEVVVVVAAPEAANQTILVQAPAIPMHRYWSKQCEC